MAEKEIKMIYYISPEKTDHYVKKNRVKNYYYTPDEMDRIITDSAKNNVKIKIVGSIKLKTAVWERNILDRRNYLCIDGRFYEINRSTNDLITDGYFYLGDNMYLQYVKTKWFLIPLYIILLTMLLILPAVINNSKPVKDGETKPVIIPDIDEKPGTIHQPDGRNDILQQVEHGALSVVNGYLALGRLYRGIICNNLRQYVLLGDASAMTDGMIGNEDDRWVFTENNPMREMKTAADLAASSRVLRGFNDTLSVHCRNIASEIFAANLQKTSPSDVRKTLGLVQIAAEMYQTTGEKKYLEFIADNWDICLKNIASCAWYLAPVEKLMNGDKKYREECASFREALAGYSKELETISAETPYGVPYRPSIWGAGWDIQSFGFRHYFLARNYPEIFAPDQVFNALNFILGCHPGLNQQSFASGVGAQSATVGYGLNRADWSYIPGGVVSGTALIRPDFPELLVFPYLWQQVEYVLGGGSSHYMFLVLATLDLMRS